jgi:hypothetical protein
VHRTALKRGKYDEEQSFPSHITTRPRLSESNLTEAYAADRALSRTACRRLLPNADNYIRDSIRTRAKDDRIIIEVEVISWPHPHEPHTDWVQVTELPRSATPQEVDKAITTVLKSQKYFMVCKECGERTLSGCMYDRSTCHACAETKHGVVY